MRSARRRKPRTATSTLDATAGRVRMHLTHLLGTVKSALPGCVDARPRHHRRHRAAAFDFAGTGVAPAQDAEAASYEVETGNPQSESAGRRARPPRVFGFVTPFGTAPPDFEGRTVVGLPRRAGGAVRRLGRRGHERAVPLDRCDGGIVIDNHNARIGARHFIADRSAAHRRDRRCASAPRIVTDTGEAGVVRDRRAAARGGLHDVRGLHREAHREAAAAQKAVGLTATGSFDAATSAFTARRVFVDDTLDRGVRGRAFLTASRATLPAASLALRQIAARLGRGNCFASGTRSARVHVSALSCFQSAAVQFMLITCPATTLLESFHGNVRAPARALSAHSAPRCSFSPAATRSRGSDDDVDFARAALERNEQLSVVAFDKNANTFTVRVQGHRRAARRARGSDHRRACPVRAARRAKPGRVSDEPARER